jgi:hypothetical protein
MEKMFVVRHKKRTTICLPCANVKTHGKQFFTERFFGVRPKKCARQSFVFP